jgi:hypothetical protein
MSEVLCGAYRLINLGICHRASLPVLHVKPRLLTADG